MSGYFDPAARAEGVYRERERQRQRFEWALRGWLRVHATPRASVFIFLCGAATVAFALASVASEHGVAVELCVIYAVILMWIVFVLLLRWRASLELRRVDISRDNIDHFIACEEVALQDSSTPEAQQRWEMWRRSAEQAYRNQSGAGGNDVLLLLVLGSATLGIWVIWQLVRAGPALLAQVLLDAVIVPAHPRLAEKINLEPWHRSIIGMTGPHFLALTIAVFVLPYLILAIQQAHHLR